jgi:hypothetical protein
MKSVEAPSAPRPKRGPRPKPKLAEAVEDEIQRVAAEIVNERSAEGRRVAALELAARALQRCADLLAVADVGSWVAIRDPRSFVPSRPAPPKIKNPCVLCGREGAFQDKSGRGGRPWYCTGHAQGAVASLREDATGLLGALKQASAIDDSSLPA